MFTELLNLSIKAKKEFLLKHRRKKTDSPSLRHTHKHTNAHTHTNTLTHTQKLKLSISVSSQKGKKKTSQRGVTTENQFLRKKRSRINRMRGILSLKKTKYFLTSLTLRYFNLDFN